MPIVKVEGLRELDQALGDLPKATDHNVLKRTLLTAAKPVLAVMDARAPVLTGELERSIIIGTKLNPTQAREERQQEGRYFAVVYVGTANPEGVWNEFGTFHMAAQPFARPAWDATQGEVLATISAELGSEIEKARARLARKAARLAAKG